MLFVPKSLFDRIAYLMGAILWPALVIPLIVSEEIFCASVVTVLSAIAWRNTYLWIMGPAETPSGTEKPQ